MWNERKSCEGRANQIFTPKTIKNNSQPGCNWCLQSVVISAQTHLGTVLLPSGGRGRWAGPDAGGGLKLLQTGKTQSGSSLTAGFARSSEIRTGKALQASLNPPLDSHISTQTFVFVTVNMSESAEALAANQKSRRNVTIEITNMTSDFCLLDPK